MCRSDTNMIRIEHEFAWRKDNKKGPDACPARLDLPKLSDLERYVVVGARASGGGG